MRGDFKDEARRFEDIDIAAQRKAEYPSLREDCPETEADVVESGEAECPVCGLPADDHPPS